MSSKKVIVAGHICLDITPKFLCDTVTSVNEVLRPGKLINVENADIHPGGIVANTGLALNHLGVNVSLIGKVGDDEFGLVLLQKLERYNIGLKILSSEKDSTSYSIVLSIPGVDRIFIHSSGANDTFDLFDIDFSEIEDTDIFHFGYPTVMKRMYENNGENLVALFKKLKGIGIITSMDMAMIDEMSDAVKADWINILENTLPYVDIFVPSYEEILFILDRDKYDSIYKGNMKNDIWDEIDIEADIRPLANKLIEMGAKIVLIKCGSKGIYYESAGCNEILSLKGKLEISVDDYALKRGFQKSFKPKKVVSATGAGDTCVAAFIASILRGFSLEKAVKYAAAEGACCVEDYNALDGLLDLHELEKRIESEWKIV